MSEQQGDPPVLVGVSGNADATGNLTFSSTQADTHATPSFGEGSALATSLALSTGETPATAEATTTGYGDGASHSAIHFDFTAETQWEDHSAAYALSYTSIHVFSPLDVPWDLTGFSG